MDITDALMTAAHFHDLEKPQRNSDGDTMREAATEIHKLRAERERLRTGAKAAFHELGGIGHESSKEFHRIGIDSARGILERALTAK